MRFSGDIKPCLLGGSYTHMRQFYAGSDRRRVGCSRTQPQFSILSGRRPGSGPRTITTAATAPYHSEIPVSAWAADRCRAWLRAPAGGRATEVLSSFRSPASGDEPNMISPMSKAPPQPAHQPHASAYHPLTSGKMGATKGMARESRESATKGGGGGFLCALIRGAMRPLFWVSHLSDARRSLACSACTGRR